MTFLLRRPSLDCGLPLRSCGSDTRVKPSRGSSRSREIDPPLKMWFRMRGWKPTFIWRPLTVGPNSRLGSHASRSTRPSSRPAENDLTPSLVGSQTLPKRHYAAGPARCSEISSTPALSVLNAETENISSSNRWPDCSYTTIRPAAEGRGWRSLVSSGWCCGAPLSLAIGLRRNRPNRTPKVRDRSTR